MKIEDLYDELTEAYSNDNLNCITGHLISLYKNGNIATIRNIANRISDYVVIDEEKDAKCFSRLMMLYHPDKGEQYRTDMRELFNRNNIKELNKYAHIRLLSDIETVSAEAVYEDIDYQPEYAWDFCDVHDDEDGWNMGSYNGFSYTDVTGEGSFVFEDFEKSFFNMFKVNEYGNPDVEIPTYYLIDLEEYDLAHCGLESLDGVDYCVNIKYLDISNNRVTDISNIWSLKNLEELYLANNQITLIDSIINLYNLRVLDLSGNPVRDVTPLFNLRNLEYVNLIGNPVSFSQIEMLENIGVVVMSDIQGRK